MLRLASPVACTYGEPLVTKLEHEVLFDCFPYEWQSGTSDGLFLPIYPPRGMRSSTLLRGLIKLSQYVYEFFMINVESMDYTHSQLSAIASLSSTAQLSSVNKPSLYLPQNNHHTYLSWHFHSHSKIYCHATSIMIIYMTSASLSYCFA